MTYISSSFFADQRVLKQKERRKISDPAYLFDQGPVCTELRPCLENTHGKFEVKKSALRFCAEDLHHVIMRIGCSMREIF